MSVVFPSDGVEGNYPSPYSLVTMWTYNKNIFEENKIYKRSHVEYTCLYTVLPVANKVMSRYITATRVVCCLCSRRLFKKLFIRLFIWCHVHRNKEEKRGISKTTPAVVINRNCVEESIVRPWSYSVIVFAVSALFASRWIHWCSSNNVCPQQFKAVVVILKWRVIFLYK